MITADIIGVSVTVALLALVLCIGAFFLYRELRPLPRGVRRVEYDNGWSIVTIGERSWVKQDHGRWSALGDYGPVTPAAERELSASVRVHAFNNRNPLETARGQ